MLGKSSIQILLYSCYIFSDFFTSKLGYVGASNSVLMDLDFVFFFFLMFELLLQLTVFEKAVSQVHFPGRGIPPQTKHL